MKTERERSKMKIFPAPALFHAISRYFTLFRVSSSQQNPSTFPSENQHPFLPSWVRVLSGLGTALFSFPSSFLSLSFLLSSLLCDFLPAFFHPLLFLFFFLFFFFSFFSSLLISLFYGTFWLFFLFFFSIQEPTKVRSFLSYQDSYRDS